MPPPTTAVLFSGSTPPAPPGTQLAVPQTDGAQPAQMMTFALPLATAALAGVVKPDGTSITQDADGTIHAVVAGGGGGGGGSASGGLYVCVSPAADPTDGTRTQWILPAPVLAGTIPFVFRNGAILKQNGNRAEFSIQGTQLTLKYPLENDGLSWLEVYYIQGTPNSETGGGGSVTPVGAPTFLQGNNNYTTGLSVSAAFPSNNAAGDCLIVDVIAQENFAGAGSLSISDSQGNTWVLAGTTHERNNILIETWYALNCAGGANTVTVTYSTSTTHPGMAIAIHEYAAVKTASAFDTDAYGFDDTGFSLPIALSLTTAADGDLLHLFASCEAGGITLTNSGGWTVRESNNGGTVSIFTFDALAGVAGNYSNGVNIAGGSPPYIQGYLLALKST